MSDSVRPHRRQPIRLPRPWDSPGKNTGVGCHFLLQCMKAKSASEVAQSYPTLGDPRTAVHQAPPFMGFSRQEYWSGVPSPSPAMRETRVQSLGQEEPLEKEMATHLPGKFHGWRCLVGYSPWGRKESDTTGRLHFLTFTATRESPNAAMKTPRSQK